MRNDSCLSGSLPLDVFVEAAQNARKNRLDSKREWRKRNGKYYQRWSPKVGDAIDVLCIGTHYGIDSCGKKWRLPEGRDIISAFEGMEGAWFRVTRVEGGETKNNTPYSKGNPPANRISRPKRPHRRTDRKSPGRPTCLHFTVEHVVGPVLQWTLPATEGHRDVTIYRLIVKLHSERFCEAEVLARALDLARRCTPPFDEDEVRRKVDRVFHPEPMSPEVRTRIETQKAAKREVDEPAEVRFRGVRPLTEYLRGARSGEESLVRLWGWMETAFRGRPDCYAYYVGYKNGGNRADPYPKPTKTAVFTPAVLQKHLTGSPRKDSTL